MTEFGGQDQDAFLKKLRAKMRTGASKVAHPGSYVSPPQQQQGDFSRQAAAFTKALEALGGKVIRVERPVEGYKAVGEYLSARGARKVIAGRAGGGTWDLCEASLAEQGIVLERFEELDFAPGSAARRLGRVNEWDAGIDWADYAAADHGSLAVLSSGSQGRTVSLLPPVHISFVAREALYPSRRLILEEVARRFKSEGVYSGLSFITGPSRSADIEMDLSIGVHGPGEVVVVLVEA